MAILPSMVHPRSIGVNAYVASTYTSTLLENHRV
eukprot:CAMPEP_0194369580 /NCGR_PEP_ID=MMETSP0174-20130528/17899_1 /TAXON_ID=216777 /ORGANISM="Proboscia alata, Strain PI-D3" /LENGTH=33 /DNA_ID= /DNA_START= /DNA_END= /DNA_ORIENTATION=